jgi:hypothetical protein
VRIIEYEFTGCSIDPVDVTKCTTIVSRLPIQAFLDESFIPGLASPVEIKRTDGRYRYDLRFTGNPQVTLKKPTS